MKFHLIEIMNKKWLRSKYDVLQKFWTKICFFIAAKNLLQSYCRSRNNKSGCISIHLLYHVLSSQLCKWEAPHFPSHHIFRWRRRAREWSLLTFRICGNNNCFNKQLIFSFLELNTNFPKSQALKFVSIQRNESECP